MTMIPAIEVPSSQAASTTTISSAAVSASDCPGLQEQLADKEVKAADHIKPSDPTNRTNKQEGNSLGGAKEFLLCRRASRVANPQLEDSSRKPISLVEKSVIIHRDENGFGLRVKGQAPVFVEHAHESGAAWRAGVRRFDLISKVNGTSVASLDHKEVVLMFKSCSRFVGLTLLSSTHSTCCAHWPGQLEANNNVLAGSATNQFQARGCHLQAATMAAASDEFGGRASRFVGSHQCVCHIGADGDSASCSRHRCRRRRLLLAPTGSTRTLLSLNLRRQQQQHRLSGETNDGANNEYQMADCRAAPTNSRRSHHKLSLISMSTSQQQQYIDLPGAGSRSANQQIAAVSPRDDSSHTHDNNNNNNSGDKDDDGNRNHDKCSTTINRLSGPWIGAKRSESVSCKPCYMSVPQPEASSTGADKDPRTGQSRDAACVCVSCRLSSSKECQPTSLEHHHHHHQQQPHQQRQDMDSCQQCKLIRSSMGLAHRLQLEQRHRSGELGSQSKGSQTSDNNKMSSIRKEQSKENHKLSQSASTSSLPTESQRAKQNSKQQLNRQDPLAATIVQRSLQTNKRLEIIRELIDTERTHTDRLRCLDELFYRPLKSGGFMTSEQLRMVFSCHRTLYKIHRQIYRILLSVNFNLYPEPLIGSALVEIFEGDLKRRLERAACSFCASQSSNAELLNKLTRRDTKVGEFLAHVTSQQMVGRLGIKDLLASCFQRLTKYPLLLENLLKATPQAPPKLTLPIETMRVKSALQAARQRKVNSSIEADEESGSLEADDDEDAAAAAGADQEIEQTGADHERPDQELELELEPEERRRRKALEDSQRIMAISLAEEREFIERALQQSRQILVRVNESVKVAISHNKLKEIWKRTDKYPGVPLIDITKQQVVHEGLLTLRLSKRSFDVYVLLLNDYLIILTREGQDKYRLKFFTPEGKSSSSSNSSNVYSPVFVIDEHLTTRDAATDENGFYLLCKRKDDSRIYEFASRSPAERSRWRDKIQWTIERQMGKSDRRRSSCDSQITKSSSEISSNRGDSDVAPAKETESRQLPASIGEEEPTPAAGSGKGDEKDAADEELGKDGPTPRELTKIEGTISLVEDDGIIQPNKIKSSRALVDQAIQVNVCDMRLEKPVTSN